MSGGSPNNLTFGGVARYEPLVLIAQGGMASVYLGWMRGGLGFRQFVAMKKLHPHLCTLPKERQALVEEARIASLLRHANVVGVRDVDAKTATDVFLILDYVEGATLAELLVQMGDRRLPSRVVLRVVFDLLAGLHAAHELADERGQPIELVHRDVSPQNVMVGLDGIARVMDFGIAKFKSSLREATEEGTLRGKIAYMPPEYVRGEGVDRRFDVFSLGVVAWEALTGARLFRGESPEQTLYNVQTRSPPSLVPVLGPEFAPLDEVLALAMAKPVASRFRSCAAMGAALEHAVRQLPVHAQPASAREVGELVASLFGPGLEKRRREAMELLKPQDHGSKPVALALPATSSDEPTHKLTTEAAGESRDSLTKTTSSIVEAAPATDGATQRTPGRWRAHFIVATILAALGFTALGVVFAKNRSTSAHQEATPTATVAKEAPTASIHAHGSAIDVAPTLPADPSLAVPKTTSQASMRPAAPPLRSVPSGPTTAPTATAKPRDMPLPPDPY